MPSLVISCFSVSELDTAIRGTFLPPPCKMHRSNSPRKIGLKWNEIRLEIQLMAQSNNAAKLFSLFSSEF